ncbi:MAG: hypothetical protein JSR97_00385 [Verrucomicrobia bacterium]|nr:hypothetical protein [Verrucomicrobiota bacterium]
MEIAKKIKNSLALESEQPVKLPALEGLEECIQEFKSYYMNDFKKLIYQENSKDLQESISPENAMKLGLLIFQVFHEVEIEKYDLANPRQPIRDFFASIAKGVCNKLKNLEKNKAMNLENLFASTFQSLLFNWYLDHFAEEQYRKAIKELLYKKSSTELQKEISFENATKLRVLIFAVLPEVEIQNSNYKNREQSLRLFSVKIAKGIYQKLKDLTNDCKIKPSDLFDSPFDSSVFNWLIYEVLLQTYHHPILRLLYKNRYSADLVEELSFINATKLKLSIFGAFPEVELDEYDHENRKHFLRPFFVQKANDVYQKLKKLQKGSEIKTSELFGSLFDSLQFTWSFDEFSWLRNNGVVERILYQKDSTLNDRISFTNAMDLAQFIFETFPEVEINIDSFTNRDEYFRPFFIKMAKGICQRVQMLKILQNNKMPQSKDPIGTSELFGSPFDPLLFNWYLSMFSTNGNRDIEKLLYKKYSTNVDSEMGELPYKSHSTELHETISLKDAMRVAELLFAEFPKIKTEN